MVSIAGPSIRLSDELYGQHPAVGWGPYWGHIAKNRANNLSINSGLLEG